MAQIIVLQSKKAELRERIDGGKAIRFSYRLPKTLSFTQPYVARLAGCSGITRTVVVCCDFVSQQVFNSGYKSIVGYKAQTSSPTWVPLANDSIPAVGFVEIICLSAESKFSEADLGKVTVAIELIPSCLVYGAHGDSQL